MVLVDLNLLAEIDAASSVQQGILNQGLGIDPSRRGRLRLLLLGLLRLRVGVFGGVVADAAGVAVAAGGGGVAHGGEEHLAAADGHVRARATGFLLLKRTKTKKIYYSIFYT